MHFAATILLHVLSDDDDDEEEEDFLFPAFVLVDKKTDPSSVFGVSNTAIEDVHFGENLTRTLLTKTNILQTKDNDQNKWSHASMRFSSFVLEARNASRQLIAPPDGPLVLLENHCGLLKHSKNKTFGIHNYFRTERLAFLLMVPLVCLPWD